MRRRLLRLAPAAVLPALAGCDGPQSILQPMGRAAEAIADMTWIMFGGAAAIFALVCALAAAALLRRRRMDRARGARMVLLGGVALPVVVLTALIVYVALLGDALTSAHAPAATRIHVVGKQWWWHVEYRHSDGTVLFATANELHLPVGEPVDITVATDDVIHSFWVPALGGKIDMVPGKVNHIRLQASAPGVMRGQCAEYCGGQHAWMALYVVARPPEEHARWLAQQAEPAPEPSIPWLADGRQLFLDSGCGACHAVRGTAAEGRLGPDLTHVGGRLSIAAGRLPNNIGTLAGWIADSQGLKPGNHMPSFNQFSGEELRKLAGWLESLE